MPASLEARAKNRAHSVLSIAIALALASQASPGFADDGVSWPSRGGFPAYPQAPSERGVHPYFFANLAYDDNLFRLSDEVEPIVVPDSSDDPDKGDRFAQLGGGVRADLDWSRQRLQFDANASHYSFDRYSILDEWLYEGSLLWSWQAGDRLKGRLGYTGSRDYPDFAELQYASQDLLTSQYAHFDVDWRVLPHMELRTSAEGSRFDHSDPTRRDLDNRVGAGTAGLFFISSSNTAVGVQYKASEGDYPNRQEIGSMLISNQYEQQESSLVISKPREVSIGLDLRVGYTERQHEEVPERDFSGATGRLQLQYSPTAKTAIYLLGYHDLSAVEDLTASYAIATGGSIGPAWAPTEKIILQLAYAYEERVLDGDPGIVIESSVPREDRTRSGRFVAGYQPNDHLKIALTYERGLRTSNVYTADYDYNSAYLRLTLAL